MRDIGVVTTATISYDALLTALDSYAAEKGRRVSHTTTESVLGDAPDVIYIRNLPPKNNAYYSEEERNEIELKLGSAIRAYVSIHFGSTETAKKLALDLAQRVRETWGGLFDYGGMGGSLGVPPTSNHD